MILHFYGKSIMKYAASKLQDNIEYDILAEVNMSNFFGGFIMEYIVKCIWDDNVNVWIATSDNIPGLVIESDSFDSLIEQVAIAARELIELNALPPATSIRYVSEKTLRFSA